MDETGLREVLARVAEDQLPPSRVDIGLASRRGRRRAHWRRIYLPYGAPVAAAAAVALIAGLPQAVTTNNQQPPTVPSVQNGNPPKVAPPAFDALEPFAVWGWLPRAIDPDAMSYQDAEFSDGETLSAYVPRANGESLQFQIWPAHGCKVVNARRARLLECGTNGSIGSFELTTKAPPVDGGKAYWVGNNLAWQYGKSGWAQIIAANLSRAEVLKVAATLRYQSARFRYGFAIDRVPAGWRQLGQPDGTFFTFTDGKPTPDSWYFGQRSNGEPTLQIWAMPPADRTYNTECAVLTHVHKQSIKLDGTRATLLSSATAAPSQAFEALCDRDLRGLDFGIILITRDAGATTPAPGVSHLGGVLGVFHHLRLLGPDAQNWTTNPLR